MSLYIDIEKKLENFNLNVKLEYKDGILGFLGESGSGKSITLKCIAGLENPTKGKIILNDRVLFDSENNINLSPQERKVGFLFQNYALFPHMNVTQNIELALDHLKKDEKRKLSKEYIQKLCLEGLEKRYPWQLSGGQQQRVALARVLVTSPDILLLDEPFSALDNHLRYNMEKELINVLNDYNGEVIFVTHDISEAYRVCDDIVVYDNGISLPKTNKEELFNKPKSLSQAKITGCNNISRAKKIDKNKVYALDWDIECITKEDIKDNIEYIGIRKHNIEILNGSDNSYGENVFKFKICNIINNPFTDTIYIKNKNNKCIEIEINNKYKLENKDDILVKLTKEHIFYF